MRVELRGEPGEDTRLVGREAEMARLRGLVAPPHAESRVLLLLGEGGAGKSALLALAAGEARSAGMRVLTSAGRESEQDLAFAGLHQLLRPVLDRVDGLPARQAEALLGAFAISSDPVPPDALLTGIAVLTLLSGLSEDGPLLVVADDAQWLDQGSLDALAFAARRLESEQLVLLLAARGTVPPAGFERDFPEPLLLAPLSLPDAGRLLDAQPRPPRGRAREQVLDQAAGNPLALIELSKVIAADPGAGRRWAAEPLPLTGRLTASMATRFAALPRETRAALLLAAAADSPELTIAVRGLTAAALGPAEAAGMIGMDGPRLRFTHPLVRAAVYHAVPFAERAAAHLTIAGTLRDQPDRYAWHLAAAALEPDEHVAALLQDSAARAQRRGGSAAAARALERAAELSPREEDQARRLLAASALALPAGQADWVRELAGKVLTLTSDPDLRIAAREANDIASAYKMETVAGSADLTTATVAAMRGDHDRVAPLLDRVLAVVDVTEYRGFAARTRHAAGLAALARGDYVAAYAQLSQLFATDGTPLHHHFSYLAIADIAAAAARAERRLEARALVEHALARVDPAPGPRLEQLTARARGLLAEPAGAGAHFAASLAESAGETWPFERAQLQLDYGEWLRRQRRINDAKPVLAAALETLRRLGAAPWTRRAESELRACGVAAQTPQAVPGALDGLTAQQHEIVILAGAGLTNSEIADRLFLSPRTVASHLYRSYPRLGIAGRHQLRDLIGHASTPRAGG